MAFDSLHSMLGLMFKMGTNFGSIKLIVQVIMSTIKFYDTWNCGSYIITL